jgi:hypothetical protein
VSVEEGLAMASRNNARHLQASARTGMNIEAAFRILVEDILATQEFEFAADEKRRSSRRRRSSAIGFWFTPSGNNVPEIQDEVCACWTTLSPCVHK